MDFQIKQLIQIINDIINQYKIYKEKSNENDQDIDIKEEKAKSDKMNKKKKNKKLSEYKDSFGGTQQIDECMHLL